MIQQDEHIIYIGQTRCAIAIKSGFSMKTGMREKKVIVTTRRCLFFQCLSNMVAEVEYQIVKGKKKLKETNKQNQVGKRLSVNQLPQYHFPVVERDAKIMIGDEPACMEYLRKMQLSNFLKETKGVVLLKNPSRMKFQLLSFADLKDGFRFCKALACAKAWVQYQKFCQDNNVAVNKLWPRILSSIIVKEDSVVLIDPQLFITGAPEEIQSFIFLLNNVKFAHSFQHRYSITNTQICGYALDFVQAFQDKTHSLIFKNNSLTVQKIGNVFHSRLKLEHLMHLSLQKNKLTDQVFVTLQRLSKQGKRLTYFNLSHNEITLHNGTLFINFLQATQVMLNLNMKNNLIHDMCIETLQKFVIMPLNPPIIQIDLSQNKFSKRGAWRLFVGNLRFQKFHPSLNFIIYPLPLKPQTFPIGKTLHYPLPDATCNFNLHSALVQQFEQESFMKHHEPKPVDSDCLTIKLMRRLNNKIRLPQTKQQVMKTLQLSNRMQNFIYAPQYVENMYLLAQQIGNFQFNLPPVSKSHFIKYLADKLNEALFIRDHYSVKYLLQAFKVLNIQQFGYGPRITKVALRNEIVIKKLQNIMNFNMDECDINMELDEMVKEGLRLFLTGIGIESIYYLKFMRDRQVQNLIHAKFNPEMFIYSKNTNKNLDYDDEVTQGQLLIPYEIRVQKKINQNFYLHPWKTNYLLLSQILQEEFQECQQFLKQSSKKDKFASYFQRIQERIQFIRNQFQIFTFSKFKCTYSDLKINCARLLAMYNFISSKHYYLELPNVARKVPITKQKKITLTNQQRFKQQYHISKYPVLSQKAKKKYFYNYTLRFTKYNGEMFQQQFTKIKVQMDKFFKKLQLCASQKANRIPQECIDQLVKVIKGINQSAYPLQLSEQFYLRAISWRCGRYNSNKQILQFAPFLTMYMRPPLVMQKYLVAAILSNEHLNIGDLPLSIVSDLSKPTDINILEMQKNYVDRDWMAEKDKPLLVKLMRDAGKIQIQVRLLMKKIFPLKLPESRTVQQMVMTLMSNIKDIQDISHFWLYKGYKGQLTNLVVLQESQYLGQLVCEKDQKQRQSYFVLKRRVYCPEWKFIYLKYSEAMIDNLYYDIKTQYLIGYFFINDREMISLAAAMLIIDVVSESSIKVPFIQIMADRLKNLGNIYRGYMPAPAIQRSMSLQSQLINQMRDKINQLIMKKEHLKPLEIKKYILNMFQDFPQFLCSNYIFQDKNKKKLKVSINWLQIVVNSQQKIQKVSLQRILSIAPLSKYLCIKYHKEEGKFNKLYLYADENNIMSTAHDILTYCMMRVKMLSPSLYSAYKYEMMVEKYIRVKEPTKDKQIIEEIKRLKKKLATATPTILQDTNLIAYFKTNLYIKGSVQRKRHPNASLQKVTILQDEDTEQMNQQSRNYRMDESDNYDGLNVFNVVYPNVKKIVEEAGGDEDGGDVPSSFGRSFSEQPHSGNKNGNANNFESTVKKNYNQLQIFNQLNDQSSIMKQSILEQNSQGSVKGSKVLQNPSQNFPQQMKIPALTPLKGKPEGPAGTQTKPADGEQDFQPITTANKNRSRLPPRRNR